MMGNKAAFLSSHSSKDGFSCNVRLKAITWVTSESWYENSVHPSKKGYLGNGTDNGEKLNSFVQARPLLLGSLCSDLKHETLLKVFKIFEAA